MTVASGLGEPIATESAAWGDYDNDGLARPVRLRGISPIPGRVILDASPTRETAAGSITTRATARSGTSPAAAGVPTSDVPRGRPGATTTTTAGSISSSRTWARPVASTTTRAMARSRRRARARRHRRGRQLRLLVLGLRQRRPARPYVNDYRATLAEVVADARRA